MRYTPLAIAMLSLALAACQKHDEHAGEAGHQHAAPHGGTLVELGDHFANAELVLDRAAGTLTLYTLDSHAENAVRLTQPEVAVTLAGASAPIALNAVGSGLTGEKPGDTSEFHAASDAFKKPGELTGQIVEITVMGRAFKAVGFTLK